MEMKYGGIPGVCGKCCKKGRTHADGYCPPAPKGVHGERARRKLRAKRRARRDGAQIPVRGMVVVGTGKIAASSEKTRRKKSERA